MSFKEPSMNRIVMASLAALVGASAFAAPVTYTLDPSHTYPSFAADHFGGLSVWRGKFDATSGKVVYDKDAKSGSIEVTVDMTSIDFGMPKLNEHAKSAEIFDAAKYPTATYSGKFTKFNGASPTEAEGTLTMHGVTKPVTLKINSFLCKQNPMSKKEVCGADASATLNRADFGVNFGDKYGFKQEVTLQIQVEGSPAA
jgi:polyisoprenoid-binding protein YceI